jgi:hypothetical protein
MNVGMLWFDNDPRTALEGKVARAADYYRTKYGRTPTLCFVHPSMLPAQVAQAVQANEPPAASAAADSLRVIADGVEVRSNRSVMPNHFWIGINAQSS